MPPAIGGSGIDRVLLCVTSTGPISTTFSLLVQLSPPYGQADDPENDEDDAERLHFFSLLAKVFDRFADLALHLADGALHFA